MRASVEIKAPPREVWAVVQDVDRYHEWNPFFTKGLGKPAPGESIDLEITPVGASPTTFAPSVLAVDAPREMVWRGRVLMPGLFDGTHHLIVEPTASGGTRFTQVEDFCGVLVPFVGLEPYYAGWLRMNAALKARVEGEAALRGSRGGAALRDAP
jgi:hypothetical protein